MSWHDNGMPIIDCPEVLATAELIRRLYELPGCGAGGPLHVILEDGNTGDEHVHDSDYFGRADGRTIETYLCKRGEGTWVGGAYHHAYIDELGCPEEVADLCRLILASFRRMPEPWRAAAIAWADGTAWEGTQRMVGAALGEPPTASARVVHELIAELRQAEDTPPGPKPCISVPCPPFEGADEAPGSHGERKPVLQWAEIYGDLGQLTEDRRGNIDSLAAWQWKAWDHYRQVWRDLLLQSYAEVQQGPDGHTIRWEQVPPRDSLDTLPRYAMRIDPPPEVNVEQMLLHDAERPPQVLYRGGPMLPSVQGMFERWLADPEFDFDRAPLFVGIPDGADDRELADAIALCQRAGLLPPTPNGIVYLPAGLDLT